MMEGVRSWLTLLITASVLCAVADSLMPPGSVKQAGRLVCGLVLLCAVLSPVSGLDLEAGRRWLEDYRSGLEFQENELKEQVDEGMKTIIEREYAAYVMDKAAELGLTCRAKVRCRTQDGLHLPEEAEITGVFTGEERATLARIIQQDLGIPMERQSFQREEGAP